MTAAERGWGPWVESYQRARQVTITAGGIRLTVRKEVAHLWAGFCNEIVQRGYPLGGVADDWGFAFRNIRGSSSPSNHSWGLAVDLNATKNPMTSDGVVHTDMPRWVVDCGAKWGFSWGGHYSGSRKDPMHFEFLGRVQDVAQYPQGGPAAPPPQNGVVVVPTINPPVRFMGDIVDRLYPEGGGVLMLTDLGEVIGLDTALAAKGQPYGQEYWHESAAQLRWPTPEEKATGKTYVVVSTHNHPYHY